VLTTLRFFAAMEVVLYHFNMLEGGEQAGLSLGGLWSGGYEAVSFFFILSGFVLVYALVDHRTGQLVGSPRSFWRARIGRIAPGYLLGLLVALPILLQAVFVIGVVTPRQFVEGAILTPLALQAWWPPVATVWNFPGWSLSVEAFFYVLFPSLVIVMARLEGALSLVLASLLVLGAVAARVGLSSWTPAETFESWSSFLLYFPLFHLPKFLLGMALGRYFAARQHPEKFYIRVFYASSLALVALFAFRPALPAWLFNDALLSFLYACVIVGAAGSGGASRLLAMPFLVLLGEASYSIYILHAPLEFWWHSLVGALPGLGMPASSPLSFALAALSYCVFVVSLALLAHLFVERPMRRVIVERFA
jgi:peptidoglycan/LPS O-acetylase OafA/YrhL